MRTIIQQNTSQTKVSSFLRDHQQAKPQIPGQQKISSQPNSQKNTVIKHHQIRNSTKKQNDQRKGHFNTTEIRKTRHSKPKTKANGQKRLVTATPAPHSYGQPNSHKKSPVPQSSQQVQQSPRNSTAHQKCKRTKSDQSKKTAKKLPKK